MKIVQALVDYDNVKFNRQERNANDVANNLSIMVSELSAKISQIVPDSETILYRFYGGWMNLDGQTTHQGGWLLGELPKLRGKRIGRHRTSLTLATTIVNRSDLILIGTYREKAQKMVDGMISVDLMDLSAENDHSLVLASDDDDFIPSIIISSSRRERKNPCIFLRRRKKPGQGPNDHLLDNCNVVLDNL